MTPIDVATGAIFVTALFWLEAGISVFRARNRVPGLTSVEPLRTEGLPSLAIVATAKDEEARVEQAARSLLAQDYPRVTICLVDDRSTDETGRILDRLAQEDPRLRVIHLDSLPEGWIGKPHALARGAAASDSEWILFADADVTFKPDAARRAVSLAVRQGWDHVAVGPAMHLESLGEALFVSAFLVIFNASQRPWLASDPRKKNAVGIGAFNLVRREAYVRAGGHAAIRYDLIDDMALGKILKGSGARQVLAGHDGLLHVQWHPGVLGLIRGVEKNAFPGARYSVLMGLTAPWFLLAIAWLPVIGLFLPGAAKLCALLAWMGVFVCYAAAARSGGFSLGLGFLMPVGATLFVFAFLRSMAITLRRGGVRWRGTFYPLEALKRGRVW
jgi:glycosyltransferase involved in cell wall biosynthesis